MNEEKLRTAHIVGKLPAVSGKRDFLPPGLNGSSIVSVGALHDRNLVEGGGLVIEYRPTDSAVVSRVVLAFNERAMWTAGYFPEV